MWQVINDTLFVTCDMWHNANEVITKVFKEQPHLLREFLDRKKQEHWSANKQKEKTELLQHIGTSKGIICYSISPCLHFKEKGI